MDQKKRILVMEELDNNRGNKNMAMHTIEILSKIADITVAALPGWFSVLPETATIIEYNVKYKCRISQVTSFVRSLKHLWEAVKLDRKNHYDYILFLSYHTVIIYLALFFLHISGRRVFITHHNNIDTLSTSRIKKFFFKQYAPKLNHFVFEPFIKDYLVSEYKVNCNKIFVLPHPKNKYESIDEGNQYDCLGISSSNDENWIQSVIDEEKVSGFFRKNQFKVLLRSKITEFDDGYLKVVKGLFTAEEYYNLYLKAKCIVLPFPDTFTYRMSGSIIDALSNRKKVLLSNIPLFYDYQNRYPNVCQVGIEPKTLAKSIEDLTKKACTKEQNKDFDKFDMDHSEEEIKNCLIKAFKMEK